MHKELVLKIAKSRVQSLHGIIFNAMNCNKNKHKAGQCKTQAVGWGAMRLPALNVYVTGFYY